MYRVVEATNIHALEVKVNKLLSEGFTLVGGVVVVGNLNSGYPVAAYIQTLQKI